MIIPFIIMKKQILKVLLSNIKLLSSSDPKSGLQCSDFKFSAFLGPPSPTNINKYLLIVTEKEQFP